MNNENSFGASVEAFDKLIGFTEEKTDDLGKGGSTSTDVLDKLGDISKNGNPEPPKLTETNELSADLKGIESDLALPYKKDDTTDYKGLLKEKFGIESAEETVSRSEFERQAGLNYYEEEYLRQVPLEQVNALIEGKLPKDEIVRQTVEADLRKNRMFTAKRMDEQIAEYIQEGQLTAEGQKFYDGIVNEHKEAIKTWKTQAKQYAENQVNEQQTLDTLRSAQAKAFRPMDMEMPEEWTGLLIDTITGGELHEFITGAKTNEEMAQRELWMALAASPKARADLFKAIYEKGAAYGENVVAKKKFGK